MKKANNSTREPSRASLREIPEVDFSRATVTRNPYARRIAAEGITINVRRRREPSRASLREIPEVDFSHAKVKPNPYAARIADKGIMINPHRGRPKKGSETGPTEPRSVRFPILVWKRLEQRAKAKGMPLHAALRAAVLEWVGGDPRAAQRKK